jgi:hypothetical protein
MRLSTGKWIFIETTTGKWENNIDIYDKHAFIFIFGLILWDISN